MSRRKTTLDLIPDDVRRKATFRKRAKGLVKKVNELSILCGIEACAIIQGPFMIEPIVWPSSLGARHAIARFKNMSEMERTKHMADQISYLSKKISKIEEERKKLERENRKKEIKAIMYQCLAGESIDHLSLRELNDVCWMIELCQREIDEKILSSKVDSLQFT